MKRTVRASTSAILAICAVLLMPSCKQSGRTGMKSKAATGKQWRLAKETIGADDIESYKKGIHALRSLDAFGAVELNLLFYHRKLMMVPAGTLVAAVRATPALPSGATEIRVLDGPQSGKILWLYPESAEKMGFRPPRNSSG